MNRARNAFTLIELLVVIAIIAMLIGIVLPALGRARLTAKTTVCGTRLQQLGVALNLYQNDFARQLPQMKADNGQGEQKVIGALFGGKKGTLMAFGINEFGPSSRPLNPYVSDLVFQPDEEGGNSEMTAFNSPADKGSTGLPGIGPVELMYDLLGSSYTLNDHALDLVPWVDTVPTLVPEDGGRMPYVLDTARTWVLASHTIYNHDDDADRGMYWYGSEQGRVARANLLFLDSHVRTAVDVPNIPGEVENTTPDYTFLPSPDWIR